MRISMLSAAIVATLFTTGCGACGELAAEKITEKALGAAGVELDTKAGTVKVTSKDGADMIHVEGEGENATVTLKGRDGEFRFHASGATRLPDGFPFAIAARSKVQGSASSRTETENTFLVSIASEGAVEEVAAFYKQELESKGLKVERTDVDLDGKKFVTLGAKSAKREATVSISTPDEGEGSFAQFSVRDAK
jgi:hypothetical protein